MNVLYLCGGLSNIDNSKSGTVVTVKSQLHDNNKKIGFCLETMVYLPFFSFVSTLTFAN